MRAVAQILQNRQESKALQRNANHLRRYQFVESSPAEGLTPFKRLICGGAAGITSVTFTYPLDIVRTRLSIQSASFAALGKASRDRLPGMWATMVTMYKTEGGISALYRGIIPTVAGVAPYVCRYEFPDCDSSSANAYPLGWAELYDLRICEEIPYTRWRQEPKCCPKVSCRSNIRSCRTDLHISFVRPFSSRPG